MTGLIPAGRFHALDRPFRRDVFRLETLQVYRGSGEDDLIDLFAAGAVGPPPDPEQDAWEALIRAHRAAGRTVRRVHVVVEPLTSYLRFEMTWQYAPSVAAGEEIGIVVVAGDDWPAEVPHLDFWLYDDQERFDCVYAEDGTWLGVEPTYEPAAIDEAVRWRDVALGYAEPWESFVAGRPELVARLPTS